MLGIHSERDSAVVPLRTDALGAGRFETFHLEVIDDTHCAFRSANGHYLTATNGGGMGGPDDITNPLHTDLKNVDDGATFFRLDYNRECHEATLALGPVTGIKPTY